MKNKVLIVEDDALIAEDIAVMLRKEGFFPIGKAFSAEQSLQMIKANTPDVILLDISLAGEMDGIELAEIVNFKFQIPFVFITAFYDDATLNRAKRTSPAGYVVKPFIEQDLKVALHLAIYRANTPTNQQDISDQIFVKENNSLLAIDPADILYVKSDDNYCFIHTHDGKYMVHQTLKSLKDLLISKNFVQVHRSFLVNFRKINRILEDAIIIGGESIPLSRSYRKEILQLIKVL